MLDEWRAYLEGIRSKETAEAYWRGARKLYEFITSKGMTIETLQPGILSEFASYLSREEKLKASSVRLRAIAATRYLDWLRKRGVSVPEVTPPELPKLNLSDPKALSKGKLDMYRRMSASQSEPCRSLLLLLPECGLRVREICSLSYPDLETRRASGKVHLILHVKGKGGKVRLVPVTQEGIKVLRLYRPWRERLRGSWLFPIDRDGTTHISPKTVQETIRNFRISIGVPWLTPHTLRRTWITSMLRMGFDPFAVAKMAGHKDPKTIHDHYYELSIEQAMGRMNTPIDEKL